MTGSLLDPGTQGTEDRQAFAVREPHGDFELASDSRDVALQGGHADVILTLDP
jgi:hypothetical protein